MPLLLHRGLFRSGPSVFSVSRYRCGSRRFDSPHALPFVIRGNGQGADRQRLSFCEVVCIIYVVFKCVFVVRVTLISPAEFRFSYGVSRKKRSARRLFSSGRPTPFFRSVVFGTHFHSFGTVPGSPCFQGIPKHMLKCCSERVENQCTHSLTTPSGGGVCLAHIGIIVKSRTEFCITPVSVRRKTRFTYE